MKKLILVILLFSLSYSENNNTTNYNKILAKKLFEKAFKKKSSDKKIYFPLNVNNILQDEVFVKIDANDNLFIGKETIKYVISLLKDNYKNKFTYKIGKDNFTPLSSLNQFGIQAEYDRENLSINVSIPPNLTKTSLINFNRKREIDINGSILAETYAGGVNLYLNQQYQNRSDDSLAREPLTVAGDVFFNIKDFVVEGRVQYQENNHQFTRNRFRLVKDDEKNQIRYSVGDIFLPNQYRMSYREALGISIEKRIELNRDYSQNISRVNNYEFFLKNSSRVEIFINNKLDNTLHLEAGTHNIYDLGVPTGLNQIKLKIIEDSGKIEFLKFNDFSYSEILKKGTIKYGMGLGVSSINENNKIIYNKKEKLLSAYIDYGLWNPLTIKGGIQASNNYQSLGLEFLVGTNLGFFNPYMVYSKIDKLEDIKKGLDYRTNIGDLNINLGYAEEGENFRRFDNYRQKNSYKTTLYQGNLYTPLGLGFNLGISASQYKKFEEKEKKLGVSIYKKLFNTIDSRINFDTVQKDEKVREDTLYFTFDYKFGRERVGYTNYTSENRHELNVDHSSGGRYGLSTNFNYNHSTKEDKYYARANLKDEKFQLDTNYNFINSKNGTKNELVSLNLATGFVFAGDTTTITTPINSSFIIIDNNMDKLKKPLGIDGYQESDSYIYDSFALPIGDYTHRELTVDETELDFGIDLLLPIQNFNTNYKSGSVMKIEVKNLFSVTGKLHDSKTDKPLKSKAFKVFNTFTGNKFMSFTNDNGEFTIEQVDIGKYNVSLIREQQYEGIAKFNFEIKESDIEKKLIDLGTINIKMPKKKDVKKYLIFDGKIKK